MDVVYFPRKQDIIIAVSRDEIGDHFREKRGGLLRNLLDKSSDKKNRKTKGLSSCCTSRYVRAIPETYGLRIDREDENRLR